MQRHLKADGSAMFSSKLPNGEQDHLSVETHGKSLVATSISFSCPLKCDRQSCIR
ncbi:MAG: hypothetical protein ACKO24_06290 [Leptolyngbyaceae cyanobacterium]